LCATTSIQTQFVLTLTDAAPLVVAVVASLLVAVAAWRLGGLTKSGAAAATLVGACALLVSVGVGTFLVCWFALATVLSRIGKQRKTQRLRGIVEKGGQRDARQVLANGGVFCLVLFGVLVSGAGCDLTTRCGYLMLVAAAGSLAAAGADTWATEIGTMLGGRPYAVRTGERVPAGTSGAVTLPGSLAMVVGAFTLAVLAALCTVIPFEVRSVAAVAIGGTLGSVADTVIGAWFQERRRCPSCATLTEQLVHECGATTVRYSGVAGMNNDAVNAGCALVGALGAVFTVLL